MVRTSLFGNDGEQDGSGGDDDEGDDASQMSGELGGIGAWLSERGGSTLAHRLATGAPLVRRHGVHAHEREHADEGEDEGAWQTPAPVAGGPYGGLPQRREMMERAMYSTLLANHAIRRTATPPRIVASFGHSMPAEYRDGVAVRTDRGMSFERAHLDPHTMMIFVPQRVRLRADAGGGLQMTPHLLVSDVLVDVAAGVPPAELHDLLLSARGGTHPWEPIIEPSPLLRFLVTWCWNRWFYWSAVTAAALDRQTETVAEIMARRPDYIDPEWQPTTPLFVAWGPTHDMRDGRALWNRRHAGYYSRLMELTAWTLANRPLLEAQTCIYLGVERCPRWLSPEFWDAIYDMAARVYRRTSDEAAREHYVAHLATNCRVPRALVEWRLDGEPRLTRIDDLWRVTRDLCDEFPDLARWRADMAHAWHRSDDYVALRLLEAGGAGGGPL